MPGVSRAGSYRVLLQNHAVRRVFALALTGRFGYALLPLCLLFTIAQSARSFSVAAAATAVFGLSGLAMPVQARLLDRYGQRRVLPVAGLLFTATLVAIAALGAAGVRAAAGWIAVCAAAGLTAPSLGPSMRAQWRELTTGGQRSAAYSLDAVAEEVIFFLGPVAAAAVLALGAAWYGVLPVALLIPCGVAGLALSPTAPPPHPRPSAGSGPDPAPGPAPSGPLRRGAFRRLLVVLALAGLAVSATFTGVAALADQARAPGVTGVAEAAAGLASVLGGLWWGRRRPGAPWRRDLALLLALRAPLMVGGALLPSLWPAAVLVAVASLMVSPVFVVGFTASDQLTDPRHHTEASTWVTAANNIGISVGTALAGWAFARSGAGLVFGGSAVVLLAAAAACGPPVPVRRLRKARS
jgi:MFS family permease